MEGSPSKVVADRFYIVTEPMTSGNHTIHFKFSLICPDPVSTIIWTAVIGLIEGMYLTHPKMRLSLYHNPGYQVSYCHNHPSRK